MKISIITTVYKAEQDLPRLLDSMMAQKSQELEFFLIDNGSPDRCGEICKRYAELDKRFTVYTLEANIGYIRARNLGIQKCSGDFIGFCDSDDYLESGGYDRAVEKIKESQCDLYITSYKTVYENRIEVNHIPYLEGLYEKDCIYSEILPQAFGNINGKPALHGFAWKQIFRKSTILDNNYAFIPELQPYEDQIFNIDVIKACNRVYIDENVIYNYIVNEKSITAKLLANFDAPAEWKRISRFFEEKKIRATEIIQIEAYNNQVLFFIYMLILNMSKNLKLSSKELATHFASFVTEEIIDEVVNQSSARCGARLGFVKKSLRTRQYRKMFGVIQIALRLRR